MRWRLADALWRIAEGRTRDDRRLRLSLLVTLVATGWWLWWRLTGLP